MESKDEQDNLLTVAAVAKRLAMKEGTIRDWILKREISYVKVKNRGVRIKRAVVERLIADGEIPALRK